jgi:hypothetical protein
MYELRFQTTRLLGVHVSDAMDPLIVEYLLECYEKSPNWDPPC